MNISEIDQLLEQLPQASSEDLLRMDLRLRLEIQREKLRRELEAEGEAARLDDPEPVAGETFSCMSPMSSMNLLGIGASAHKAGSGTLTHILVSSSVFMDLLADGSPVFRRVQSLPEDSRVKGFIDTVPIVLNRDILDGAMFRFEDALFESVWIEIQMVR